MNCCLRKILCIEFLSRGFASSSGSNQSWNKESPPKRKRPQLREYLETGTGGLGRPLPSFKMAIRKRALSGHMTHRAPQDVSPERAQCAGAARRCEGRGAASAARGPVRAEAQPPPLPSRGSQQVKREPCRSGSGAATCAPTAAGLVSDAGPARRALPAGTPGGAVLTGGSLTAAQSLRPSGRRGSRLFRACQPRGPGLAPSRGPAERRGGGPGTGRDGTGRVRQPRKASDRSQTRAARGCRCFPFPVSRPARVRDRLLRRPTGHGLRIALLRAAAPEGQTTPRSGGLRIRVPTRFLPLLDLGLMTSLDQTLISSFFSDGNDR